jgi:oxygen-independent coproporphyrinogen III oxidase
MQPCPVSEPRALYVHVPFCHSRCPYCNFTIAIDRAYWIDRYLASVQSEIKLLPAHELSSIFIGGGTPTLLNNDQLAQVLYAIRDRFKLDANCEWSIEANPNDLTDDKCLTLLEAGVNRLSIGGQSFDASKLRRLGRDHDGPTLSQAIIRSLSFFQNVSLDLIFGVPDETFETWQSDLRTAIGLGLHHISTYGLTYEKGAMYWSQRAKGLLKPIEEGLELEMYFAAIELLSSSGYEHYEVSNFAKPGLACRHNQTYWKLEPWLAVGPGAAGYTNNQRTMNHRSTSKYLELLESQRSPIVETENIDWSQRTRERFVFGMRQLVGVDLSELSQEGEPNSLAHVRQTIDKHIERDWLVFDHNRVRLTRKGLAISDSLWPEYL